MKLNKHAAVQHLGFRDRKQRGVNDSSLLSQWRKLRLQDICSENALHCQHPELMELLTTWMVSPSISFFPLFLEIRGAGCCEGL